ncbi:MAG: TonB-dependent receptor [Saprospiraceae bacterium]
MHHYLLIAFWVILLNVLGVSQGNVQLIVQDAITSEPIIGALVVIKNKKDSAMVKADITNQLGQVAELIDIPNGNYYADVSYIGYENYTSGMFNIMNNTYDLGVISLKVASQNLEELTVTATRPFIERKIDRLVVNVANSIINTGGTAFEVLEKSPGILIDGNENITMRGKSGVLIYIDGRQSPMSGADLVNYLKNVSANNIDRIELITNPSAKYDAAGNAGIIDIKMKKDQNLGFNGSATAGYGQGVYPKANAGFSLNYRNKKINVYSSYNYGYRLNLNHLLLDRKFYDDGQFIGKDTKDNYTKIPVNFHNIRMGIDYNISKSTIIGIAFTPNFFQGKPYNRNQSQVFDENYNQTFSFKNNNTNDNNNDNGVLNFNLYKTFGSEGKDLNVDVDFGQFNTNGLSSNIAHYFDLQGNKFKPDYQLDGNQKGILQFITVKSDVTFPLGKEAKLEAGFKTSYINADQDAKFYEIIDQQEVVDVNKTNHFIYTENNNAVYVNASKAFKKWDVQLGVRAEQTNYVTNQEIGNMKFDSTYIKLFPSTFVTYKFNPETSIYANVSRRIDRPGFSDLNPFLFLIDVTTFSTGNPRLQPQFTWNYEMGYTGTRFNLSVNYSKTTLMQTTVLSRLEDIFPHLSEEGNITIQIPLNLANSEMVGMSASVPIQILKNWNSNNNLNIFYNHFTGNLSNTNLSNGLASINFSTNNNLVISTSWTAEFSFNYSSKNRYGFMIMEPRYGLGLGVQKKIFDGRGNIRFNISDIFWTNLPKARIAFDNYVEDWHAFRETRVANLSVFYRFGNNKVKQARNRKTGSEEERQRI